MNTTEIGNPIDSLPSAEQLESELKKIKYKKAISIEIALELLI